MRDHLQDARFDLSVLCGQSSRGSQAAITTVRLAVAALCLILAIGILHPRAQAQPQSQDPVAALSRFPLSSDGLQLDRPTHAGAFFDVIGRRSALFGYESRSFEAWVYPLKIFDAFSLSFRLEGYPLEIDGADIMASIRVRPESTTLTYAHAAFTVQQIMFAPLDEPGIVILLDVDSVLPLTVTAAFRPRLRLMWPATSMTASLGWDAPAHLYTLTEETGRFAGVIGCPYARDVSVMPYQEEPRDVPNRFVIEPLADGGRSRRIPIVIAGSVEGRASAKSAYERILSSIQSLYEHTANHYRLLDRSTIGLTTPDERLNTAFAWAKVGIDKGLGVNPLLGTGLLAGFRASGESERPGFAWFFGRDALWTTLALNAEGDRETARTALEFLLKYQRQDGKIPHEVSQSASIVPWFDQYPYAWASADATPLYVITHSDYWRATGDREFLQRAWPSIVRAYRFSAATDSDGNGLIENTNVGHGWVEGGALYPAHEEMYMQGLWVAASHGIAELAAAMNDSTLAAAAAAGAERTRTAMEATYWLGDRGFYAFATALPRSSPAIAEPGPNRAARQARLDAMRYARLIDEETVLPAVPLWFGAVQEDRAQAELDRLGGAALATDWGSRLLSNRSALYDPLSYHYGSVWPLFTGWTAMAAYRYGRPHVGQQALMANALLTYPGALGYVTELLSGDYATPFGRSSHHQIWSEAMVVAPAIRGLLGIETADAGRTLRLAPALPADWDRVAVHGIHAAGGRYDVSIERAPGRMLVRFTGHEATEHAVPGPTRLIVAPALPLDVRVRGVTVNGTPARHEISVVGDVQRVLVGFEGFRGSRGSQGSQGSPGSQDLAAGARQAQTDVVFRYDEGTGVYVDIPDLREGARSEGLRILRARADARTLQLTVEGRGNRTYVVGVRTPRRLGTVEGVTVGTSARGDPQLRIRFDGPPDEYVRREIAVPLAR
jgi:glycogen debranching enzyme